MLIFIFSLQYFPLFDFKIVKKYLLGAIIAIFRLLVFVKKKKLHQKLFLQLLHHSLHFLHLGVIFLFKQFPMCVPHIDFQLPM